MTRIVPTAGFGPRPNAAKIADDKLPTDYVVARVHDKLSDVEQLAFELRTLHRRVGDVSWALDEGLSAVRKAAAGYRAPDPETGRPVKFDGIEPDVLARRVLRAARLLRALEGISLE